MLTSSEYAAQGGNKCPACGSGDLDGHFIEVDGRQAWQPVDCRACGASWVDTYMLTGYANLEES